MTFICQPTDVPPASELDIPAMKEKYRQERDKRFRPEGEKQYAAPEDHLTHDTQEHDPFTPVVPRDALDEEIDVAILGGGWTGILAAYHLTKAGVTNFKVIDHAGGFGGTWYWNRYPGIQCDNDAYCYLPLLEEMNWLPSKKFEDGKQIHDYIQMIVAKFGFGEKGLFHTTIKGLNWDESIKRWHVATDRDDTIRAKFVIMAGGTLNTPKFPAVPGIHKFKGHKFHTSRWDYEYTGGEWGNPELTKLADKRVAILGTGATSIQAIPYLGKYAKELYVLQRTPSGVDKRDNPPTDTEWAASLKPGWQAARQENFLRAANELLPLGTPDLICDFWTEINRNINSRLEAEGATEHPMPEFWDLREKMDFQVMERIRRRVDKIVKDPATAEALKPYYRFMCKRPLSNNDYYDTFNLPGVKLIDVSATQGLEAMTEKGFIAGGQEYEIDAIVFASGFEVTSDLKRRWGLRRRRRPERHVDLRLLGRGAEDAARHDRAQLPQHVLHRLRPGRPQRHHDFAVRRTGPPCLVGHQPGAAAGRQVDRTEPGRPGRLPQAVQGTRARPFGDPQRLHPQLLHQRRRQGSQVVPVPRLGPGLGQLAGDARRLAPEGRLRGHDGREVSDETGRRAGNAAPFPRLSAAT
ncbi:NAD(P)/FAD-dependent oxidoreductase [Novosphingobium sp. G106]|uniref:flavin-containing monooxygenase n=1 Tax=Novosphingobium sp. G106 TaxID=2849500 RepID=UPI0020C1DAC4|nr:NAD(P)/FAD-dependent oxidoreductase [Novosphingobium sp. G106]